MRGKARQGKARQEALHLDLRKWDTFRWNYLFCCEKRSRYVEYVVVFKFLHAYSILWKNRYSVVSSVSFSKSLNISYSSKDFAIDGPNP